MAAVLRRKCLKLVRGGLGCKRRVRFKHTPLCYSLSSLILQRRHYGGNAKNRLSRDPDLERRYPLLDLRSDVRANPTPAMREAVIATMENDMDDDVFEECLVTKEVEKRLAKMLGFSHGLFVPTGTMGNLIACTVHCNMSGVMGTEVIMGEESHLYCYEQGGLGQLSGISTRTVKNEKNGTIDIDTLEKAIRPNQRLDDHLQFTKVVAVENTQNCCFGSVLPWNYIKEVREMVDRHSKSDMCGVIDNEASKIRLHMDGCRIFNAQGYWLLHLDEVPSDQRDQPLLPHLTQGLDSMTICFSKLGSPIGAMLFGNDESFIRKSRRMRKALGGSLRNPSTAAICGEKAIMDFVKDDPVTNQFCKDANNAIKLAKGLNDVAKSAGIPGFYAMETDSNMVFLMLEHDEHSERECFPMSDEEFIHLCDEYRVLFMPFGKGRFRVMVYHQIGEEQVNEVIRRVGLMFQSL